MKTAMIDVFASANLLRVPILMEYEEFRKLRINAATDPLTGLYNRRLFDEYCDKELNRARRYGQNLALVILDLHKLKQVNDRHGHMMGDKVLRMAASTLRRTLRASDFAFRIGGDEFALLLPQTEPEQAMTLCRRLRAQYESEDWPDEPWYSRDSGFRSGGSPTRRDREEPAHESCGREALRTKT